MQNEIVPRLRWPSTCMENLDRLGWAGGISFSAYDVGFGIRVNDPSILPRLQDYLPPGWTLSSSPTVNRLYSLIVGGNNSSSRVRRFNLLYKGSERLARTMDLNEALEMMESDLHMAVAVNAHRWLFVHAGVVAWNGRAIVIPGRSMSGKTTLVQALVKAGAIYYSDEYAIFDSQGYVHPYPKPLFVRQAAGLRAKKCWVETLGGHSGTEPLPVGMIVVTQYQPGVRWRPRRLSPGQVMLVLLDNTIIARKQPQLALSTLQRVVPDTLALKGKRGEAHEVVVALLKNLAEKH